MNAKIKPLVSIVTPSYNAMPYIMETVSSIQNQNYSPLEHLIFDGNSDDGTKEFLLANHNLIVKSEKDKGQSDALNKAFKIVKGEIIGWLNADDTYQPGAIQMAVDYFEQHPEVDMICSDINIIDEHSQKIGISRGKNFHLETLLIENVIKQPTIFMRKKVINQLIGVDETLHYVMDREFWLRAGLAGFTIHYLPTLFFANFRLCAGTKTFQSNPKFREEWINVIQQLFLSRHGNRFDQKIQKRAIQKNKSAYHFSLMNEAAELKNRNKVFVNFYKAVLFDTSLLINRGAWLYLFSGLFSMQVKKHRRFKKQMDK